MITPKSKGDRYLKGWTDGKKEQKEKKEEKKQDAVLKSLYSIQLEKFVGKNVEVSNLIGDKVKGKCIAINKSHLNIIIETADAILIIKNINTIRRDKKWEEDLHQV